jgi:hypothetical protein
VLAQDVGDRVGKNGLGPRREFVSLGDTALGLRV